MVKNLKAKKGFSLFEILLVLVILSVFLTLSYRFVESMSQADNFQYTLQSMETIRDSLIGNSELLQSGRAADWGYWGYMGALPSNGTQYGDILEEYLWLTPYAQASTVDGWGDNYVISYGNPFTVRSYGADDNSTGDETNFNEDIVLTINTMNFTNIPIRVTLFDRDGLLLTSTQISAVQMNNYGTTVAMNYNTSGYWELTTASERPETGPVRFLITPTGAQAALTGGISTIATAGVISATGGFGASGTNFFEFRLPGEVA